MVSGTGAGSTTGLTAGAGVLWTDAGGGVSSGPQPTSRAKPAIWKGNNLTRQNSPTTPAKARPIDLAKRKKSRIKACSGYLWTHLQARSQNCRLQLNRLHRMNRLRRMNCHRPSCESRSQCRHREASSRGSRGNMMSDSSWGSLSRTQHRSSARPAGSVSAEP